MKRQAAQGTIINNDDIGIKILSAMKEIGEEINIAEGVSGVWGRPILTNVLA